MSPSHSEETYVLDACVVIDFCGRTENLAQLMAYVDDGAVVTSVVVEELQRQRTRNFPGLQAFLDLIDTGAVSVVDPDTLDPDVTRIIGKWSSQFGAGEVSSAALAISRRFVFVSRDRAPMQQLRLSETILMETTDDVLAHLVRRGAMTKQQSEHIRRDIRAGSERHRRK
jgi:predicted nucleic acid-binding protein